MDLRKHLLQGKNFCNKTFVSVSAIEQWITLEHVLICLQNHTSKVELKEIQLIISEAPKLFTILILIRREQFIVSLLSQGFLDSMLPIAEENVPSLKLKGDRHAFLKAQEQLPLIFQRDIHMKLAGNVVFPFLTRDLKNSGAFGLIYRVELAAGHLEGSRSTQVVALKQIVKQERDEWEIMMKEEETLRKRKHPNIIPLLASFTHDTIESDCDKRSLNLIFPYAEMDMDQWMKLKQTPTWLRDHAHGRRKYLYNSMYSLVSALAFLHREIDGVITAHHDLKPENILLIGETLMISDFGRSNLIPLAQGSETNGPAGSFDYQPPEYWNDDGSRALRLHGRAFDVWAMGCIILEMATLIVHGWESEKVSQFEEERSDSSKRSRNFENKHRNDKSFHNNMNVVHNWVSRLKDHDDNSPLLSQVLMIAMAMMNIQPEERLYSWEVELDLYEILHPDDPRVVRLEKGSLGVQPPKEKDFAQRQTPLHRASIQGNRDRVSNLLKVGWLPKAKNRAGFTSIQLAKLNGNREVENLMLEHLSIRDINAEGGTLGSQIQKHFSGMGLDTGFTNLHHAARFSDAATMRLLLDQIGSAEASLVVDDFGKTPLHHAAERASEEVVSLLLAYEDPKQHLLHIKDSSGKTPLHWAAQGGNPAATQRLLLSQRATRNVLEEQDDDGKTPIELAVKYERGDVYLLLLDFKRRCSLLETPVDG